MSDLVDFSLGSQAALFCQPNDKVAATKNNEQFVIEAPTS